MTAHWWPLIEDIFAAPVLQACCKKMVDFYIDRREFETISIDATIKCCMAVMGQESYRRSAAKRNAAPFDDESAYRRVLTVRGRTSAVLAMVAVPNEKAEEVSLAVSNALPLAGLHQIQCVASDNAYLKLYAELARILPNLQALCLDPIHLAIVYEHLTCMIVACMRRGHMLLSARNVRLTTTAQVRDLAEEDKRRKVSPENIAEIHFCGPKSCGRVIRSIFPWARGAKSFSPRDASQRPDNKRIHAAVKGQAHLRNA